MALTLRLMAAAAFPSSGYAACEFAPVKQQIDEILDRDADRGGKFRREVASGSDPIAMIGALVVPDMQKRVDICRFEAAEYLTKRGYPPYH